MIWVLSIILFILLASINKWRGIKSFFSLYINFFFVIVAVLLICWGFNPIVIALLFSIGTSAFVLFFINGLNLKTKIAFLSVIIVILLTSLLIIFIGYKGNIHGFVLEHEEILYVYSHNIHINYRQVAVAVIIISLTGAITDTALDITTSLNEVHENNRHLSFLELIKSGKNIGSDLLGTMTNTLFFVFIGEFMGFFILYSSHSFATIINNKLFIQEISKLLIGSLGCVLIIPITIFIQSYLYKNNKYLRYFH